MATTLPALTIIPAGAGSGKTWSVQQRLGQWVEQGLVASDRIVAVTFTESAATELRDRIRAKLITLGRAEEALQLDQSTIATIHAFGLRLLTEFAFDLGQSPALRLLGEDEEDALIRLALARSRRAEVISRDLPLFGYGYDPVSNAGPEAQFHGDILRMVGLLRAIGHSLDDASLVQQGREWIRERYGPVGDGKNLTDALHLAVTILLRQFPENLARQHGGSKTGSNELHRDFRNLMRGRQRGELGRDWSLWQSLRTLRQSKRGAPLPEAYDRLTDVVMAAADALPRHPGPLQHGLTHAEVLIAAGEEVLDHYEQAKKTAGVVDYTDMVALSHRLLDRHPEVLTTLRERLDCLVIDEFQDTNPLQFSLLWKLKEAGIPTLVVGDLKQAIMGFQLADPRLMAELQQRTPDHCEPLTANWRSQPGIMAFVNDVGAGLFREAYVHLAAKGRASTLRPLEAIPFADKFPRGNNPNWVRATHAAARIRSLLGDGAVRVHDRKSGRERAIRGNDIAVLCPTHRLMATYAAVLRAFGVKVRRQQDGWFDSRSVQIVLAALNYVANPEDHHAALYLAVTELGSLSLEEGLKPITNRKKVVDPVLEKLDAEVGPIWERPLPEVVARVIQVLDLHRLVSSWPDAAQARANLLRLQGEARAFVKTAREALASGGFHGSGIPTFLAWLEARQAFDDKQPEPRVVEENAVQLITWHSSKGREWPVTLVCGLDRELKARLPDAAVGYDSFEDFSGLLKNARIEYSPHFHAPESKNRFSQPLQRDVEAEAKRLLYVVLTRAREKLILEWPAYVGHYKKTTYWTILTDASGLQLEKDSFAIQGKKHPCTVLAGGNAFHPDYAEDGQEEVPDLSEVGLRALEIGQTPEPGTVDALSATALKAPLLPQPQGSLHTEQYGDGVTVDLEVSAVTAGTALHRCWELLGYDPTLAPRLPAITGVPAIKVHLPVISRAVQAFETWIQKRLQPLAVRREIPFQFLDAEGRVVTGIIDHLVETEAGHWIIDHKSDHIEHPEQGFAHHWPQLSAYAKAMDGVGGKPVVGVGINWIGQGTVSWVKPTTGI